MYPNPIEPSNNLGKVLVLLITKVKRRIHVTEVDITECLCLLIIHKRLIIFDKTG